MSLPAMASSEWEGQERVGGWVHNQAEKRVALVWYWWPLSLLCTI